MPGCHGRFNLRGNSDGYIGNVVKGSISHNDTRGCLSPAVDSSQPTYAQWMKQDKQVKTFKTLNEIRQDLSNIWNTNYAETLNRLKPSQEGELKTY